MRSALPLAAAFLFAATASSSAGPRPPAAPAPASRAGGTGSDVVIAMAPLKDGSVLVTGYFTGSAVVGGTTLTAQGGFDVFVARYRPDGVLAWATRAGGAAYDVGKDVAVLADGSALVVGTFEGTAHFGATSLTSAGRTDSFVAKLTPEGSVAWAVRIGGAEWDEVGAVAALPDGSALVTGRFSGAADVDEVRLTSAGDHDVFLARFHPDGGLAWARRYGAEGLESGNALGVLPGGDLVLAGNFTGTTRFGGTALTSAGQSDVLLARLQPDGEPVWAQRAGGPGEDVAVALAVRGDGGVLVTGAFEQAAAFAAAPPLRSAGHFDAFLAQYAPGGALAWATRVGGPGRDWAEGLVALGDGSVLVVGEHAGTSTFGGATLTSAGSTDAFVARFAQDGRATWARRAGGPAADGARSIVELPGGSALVGGAFEGRADFAGVPLTSAGRSDGFLWRVAPPR